jgi:mannobiose 2-epimerase
MQDKLNLEEFKLELESELREILHYWMQYTPDPVFGGYYGRIDNNNQVYPESPRNSLLYSHILWAFSAAFNRSQDKKYLRYAERAYEYIKFFFEDPKFGGVYLAVDHRGNKLDSTKRIDGQACCISALSEYYKAIKEQDLLEYAVNLYRLIELHAYDQKRKGYYQSHPENWSGLDERERKSGNLMDAKTAKTHICLLEAYTNLFSVWKNAGLRNQIENLLEVFAHHFVDAESHHLCLSFDEEWNSKSKSISLGDEIEAAWILQQAAEAIKHKGWSLTMKGLALRIAEAVCEGWNEQEGLFHQANLNKFVKERYGWAQAEAMVGFYNAYQVCCEERWLNKSLATWEFIKNFIKDSVNGEWFAAVDEKLVVMNELDKAGSMKSPYHNVRACLELIQRMTAQPVLKKI